MIAQFIDEDRETIRKAKERVGDPEQALREFQRTVLGDDANAFFEHYLLCDWCHLGEDDDYYSCPICTSTHSG